MAKLAGEKSWSENDRILRGLPPKPGGASKPEDERPIVDQPVEDGGPVRSEADAPFVREKKLIEADQS